MTAAQTSTRCVPFWVDGTVDVERASDGISRYGAYLRQKAQLFEDPWDSRDRVTTDPVEFGVAAWIIASSPNMSPGYLQHHPRILDASLERNNHDGSLLAAVSLAASRPAALRSLTGFTEWDRSPASWGSHDRSYHEPSEESLSKRPAMLTTVRLLLPIPPARLHVPVDAPECVSTSDAKAAVQLLVSILNEQVQPVLDALEANRRDAR